MQVPALALLSSVSAFATALSQVSQDRQQGQVGGTLQRKSRGLDSGAKSNNFISV